MPPIQTYAPQYYLEPIQAVAELPMGWVYLGWGVLISVAIVFSVWLYVSSKYPAQTRGLSPLYQFLLITVFIYAVVFVLAGYNDKVNEQLALHSWWWIAIGVFTFGLFMLPTIKKRITYRERSLSHVQKKVVEFMNENFHGAMHIDTLANAAFWDFKQIPIYNDFGERELAYDFMVSPDEESDVNIIISKYGTCQVWEWHTDVSRAEWIKRRDKESIASHEQALRNEEELVSQKIGGDIISSTAGV